jgi:hypothetical protein
MGLKLKGRYPKYHHIRVLNCYIYLLTVSTVNISHLVFVHLIDHTCYFSLSFEYHISSFIAVVALHLL